MTKESVAQVRIPEGVLYQYLQGETVLLDLVGGVYYGLDCVGTLVWQQIEQHGELELVREALLNEYDVSEKQCDKDLRNLVCLLVDKGLLEIVHGDEGTS